MKNELFIEKLETAKYYIENVVELANEGKVQADEEPDPTAQQQCYLAHQGMCGSCDITGGWTGC